MVKHRSIGWLWLLLLCVGVLCSCALEEPADDDNGGGGSTCSDGDAIQIEITVWTYRWNSGGYWDAAGGVHVKIDGVYVGDTASSTGAIQVMRWDTTAGATITAEAYLAGYDSAMATMRADCHTYDLEYNLYMVPAGR